MWIPDFLLKLFGRKVADKLELTEGPMDSTKKWYQSKNIWNSVVTGLVGLYLALAPQFGWPAIPEWIFTILAAIGIYTRVTADKTIG
jgi:hypothetical protein